VFGIVDEHRCQEGGQRPDREMHREPPAPVEPFGAPPPAVRWRRRRRTGPPRLLTRGSPRGSSRKVVVIRASAVARASRLGRRPGRLSSTAASRRREASSPTPCGPGAPAGPDRRSREPPRGSGPALPADAGRHVLADRFSAPLSHSRMRCRHRRAIPCGDRAAGRPTPPSGSSVGCLPRCRAPWRPSPPTGRMISEVVPGLMMYRFKMCGSELLGEGSPKRSIR
jgi:hypothetical protein